MSRVWSRPSRVTCAISLCFLVGSLSPLSASQIRILSLDELTQRSQRIVAGRCVEVRVVQDPSLKLQVTHVTLEVERGVKGNGQGRLTFKMLGDQRAVPEKGLGIEGVPRFAVGEELVLFLYGESRSGLTSPVGFGQGKFSVVRDKEGRAVATNAFGNRHLFEGLPEDAKEKLQGRQERWKGEVGIPPEVLLDLVTRLAR